MNNEKVGKIAYRVFAAGEAVAYSDVGVRYLDVVALGVPGGDGPRLAGRGGGEGREVGGSEAGIWKISRRTWRLCG